MCELNADVNNAVCVSQRTVAYSVSFAVHKTDITSRYRWETGFVVIFPRYWFSTSQQKIRYIVNNSAVIAVNYGIFSVSHVRTAWLHRSSEILKIHFRSNPR